MQSTPARHLPPACASPPHPRAPAPLLLPFPPPLPAGVARPCRTKAALRDCRSSSSARAGWTPRTARPRRARQIAGVGRGRAPSPLRSRAWRGTSSSRLPEEWRWLASARVLVTVAGLDLLSARGRAYVRALRASGWRGEAELYEAWRAPCLLPQQARQLQGNQGDGGRGRRGQAQGEHGEVAMAAWRPSSPSSILRP